MLPKGNIGIPWFLSADIVDNAVVRSAGIGVKLPCGLLGRGAELLDIVGVVPFQVKHFHAVVENDIQGILVVVVPFLTVFMGLCAKIRQLSFDF